MKTKKRSGKQWKMMPMKEIIQLLKSFQHSTTFLCLLDLSAAVTHWIFWDLRTLLKFWKIKTIKHLKSSMIKPWNVAVCCGVFVVGKKRNFARHLEVCAQKASHCTLELIIRPFSSNRFEKRQSQRSE